MKKLFILLSLCTFHSPIIYAINFRTLEKGKMRFSTFDKTFIDAMSPLCPLRVGNAVYKARVLRSVYFPDVRYVENCDIPAAPSEKIAKPIITTHKEKVSIYPNPANDLLTFNFESQGNYDLIIRNITGQIVKKTSIDNSNSTIDISDIENGIIICELWKTNQCVAKEKVIIIR